MCQRKTWGGISTVNVSFEIGITNGSVSDAFLNREGQAIRVLNVPHSNQWDG
jgi:hypothetical protein